MSYAEAVRLTECLLGLAFLQQSLEHLAGPRDERLLHLPRLLLSAALVAGWQSGVVALLLLGLGLLLLRRFDGPYNGGADRMGLLVLSCLSATHFAPTPLLKEASFGYLAAQLVLSYFMSGWVKVVNPAWRRGEALVEVFAYSAYPVSESLRGWAARPRLLWAMGWAVMLFELAFPLALIHPVSLAVALVTAALFHLANACLFGLNRFLWAWLAAYPALWWCQGRLLP
ncbi:MAG: HTTM domain-containing protein [Gammaproteobacteria bacterium]|nr:HTTM domain-containing protein [Gammaproteobacteria bacterium]